MVVLMCKGDIHTLLWMYADTDVWPQGEGEGLEWKVAHMWVKIQPVPTPPQITSFTEAETSTRGKVQPLNAEKK